jgi:hypothetical protein
VASSSGPFAILICVHAGRTRGALVRILLVLLPATALSLLGAFSGGTERYREAVEFVLEEHAPGEALIVIEAGPAVFPPAAGWTYYSERLQPDPDVRPERLAMANPYELADPEDLARYERVQLFVRGADYAGRVLEQLRERFAVEEAREFGYSLAVHTFSGPRALSGTPRSDGKRPGPDR